MAFLQKKRTFSRNLSYFCRKTILGVFHMNLMADLDLALENFRREFSKFERGNKSAGTRARKHLQDIKKTCQDFRNYIQAKKEDEGEEK